MIMVYDLSPRPQNTSQIDLCSTVPPPLGFSDIPTAHASAFQTYTTMGAKAYEIQIKSKLNFHPATISGEKDFSFFLNF